MWPRHVAAVALCILGSIASARGLYYIDDQDGSITYTSSAGVGYNTKWVKYSPSDGYNGLAVAVDQKTCFGGTATYTQCFTADHCTMTIPFNGTGITLFVAMDYGDIYNTSISLDGAPPAIHFAYNRANAEAYNFTLYDVQGLAWTPHILAVALAPGVSRLLFDYAAVTGDAPSSAKGSGAAAAAAAAPSVFLSAVMGALVLAGAAF